MKNHLINNEILLLAESDRGDGALHVCPSCRGGRTGEAKFGIKRVRGGYLYNCFRASCGFKGFITSKGVDFRSLPPRDQGREYKGKLVALPRAMRQYFERRFGLGYGSLLLAGVRWTGTRVWCPFYNHHGYVHAAIGQAYNSEQLAQYGCENPSHRELFHAKTVVLMREPGSPMLSLFPASSRDFQDKRMLYLVEDYFSAVKLWYMGRASCCIMGTYLSFAQAAYLAYLTDRVTIVLDKDATSKAYKMQRQVSLLFAECNVIPLPGEDIKDLPYRAIEELLS